MEPAPPHRLRRLLRALLPLAVVLGTLALVVSLFHAVMAPFVLALVLVYVMEPVVQRLNLRGTFGFHWPRWLAIVSVYLTLMSAVVAFGFLAVPTLAVEITRLAKEAPTLLHDLRNDMLNLSDQAEVWIEVGLSEPPADGEETEGAAPAPTGEGANPPGTLPAADPAVGAAPAAAAAPAPADPPKTRTPARATKKTEEASPPAFTIRPTRKGGYEVHLQDVEIEARESSGGWVLSLAPPDEGGRLLDLSAALDAKLAEFMESSGDRVGEAVTLAKKVAGGVFGSIVALVLTFMIAAFISMDLASILDYFRSLVPMSARPSYDLLLTQLDRRLSGVIRGQLIICLLNGALTWGVLMLLDMRFVALLTVIATISTLVPIFGMIVSSIPMVAVAVIDGGLERGVLVVAGVLFIHFLEANFFNPKILGTTARINPVLIIFALLAGEHSFGLLGALLAVPTMAIALTLFQFGVEQLRVGGWSGGSGEEPPPSPESAG